MSFGMDFELLEIGIYYLFAAIGTLFKTGKD